MEDYQLKDELNKVKNGISIDKLVLELDDKVKLLTNKTKFKI